MAVTPRDVEIWALAELSRLANSPAGAAGEDALVELKREWPADTFRAARQVAAHANAARGNSILWLIGVDEKARSTPGVVAAELSSWWPAVLAHFEGEPPTLIDRTVSYAPGVVVVALCFSTDLAPYVVRNPSFGQKQGGVVRAEVPWREGTRVETATREQLLLILSASQRLPEFELVDASLRVGMVADGPEGRTVQWQLRAFIYVKPRGSAPIGLPSFNIRAHHSAVGTSEFIEYERVVMSAADLRHDFDPHDVSKLLYLDLVIERPGLFEVNAQQFGPIAEVEQPRAVQINITPAMSAVTAILRADLAHRPVPGSRSPYRWITLGGKLYRETGRRPTLV